VKHGGKEKTPFWERGSEGSEKSLRKRGRVTRVIKPEQKKGERKTFLLEGGK